MIQNRIAAWSKKIFHFFCVTCCKQRWHLGITSALSVCPSICLVTLFLSRHTSSFCNNSCSTDAIETKFQLYRITVIRGSLPSFSSPGTKWGIVGDAGPTSCVINKCFKALLLLNCWAIFYQISQKCFMGSPLSDSFKLWSSMKNLGCHGSSYLVVLVSASNTKHMLNRRAFLSYFLFSIHTGQPMIFFPFACTVISLDCSSGFVMI